MKYGVNAMLLKFGVIQMRRIDCCNDMEKLIQNRSEAMMIFKQLLLLQLKSTKKCWFCLEINISYVGCTCMYITTTYENDLSPLHVQNCYLR